MMLIMLFCLKVLLELKTEFNFIVVLCLPYKLWWQKNLPRATKNMEGYEIIILYDAKRTRCMSICYFSPQMHFIEY